MRKSPVVFILVGLVFFCGFAMIIGAAVSAAGKAGAREALLDDLHSGKLSDPGAFQMRCGKASSMRQEKDGTTLLYSDRSLHVTLQSGAPVKFFRVAANDTEMPVSDDFALDHLECRT